MAGFKLDERRRSPGYHAETVLVSGRASTSSRLLAAPGLRPYRRACHRIRTGGRRRGVAGCCGFTYRCFKTSSGPAAALSITGTAAVVHPGLPGPRRELGKPDEYNLGSTCTTGRTMPPGSGDRRPGWPILTRYFEDHPNGHVAGLGRQWGSNEASDRAAARRGRAGETCSACGSALVTAFHDLWMFVGRVTAGRELYSLDGRRICARPRPRELPLGTSTAKVIGCRVLDS